MRLRNSHASIHSLLLSVLLFSETVHAGSETLPLDTLDTLPIVLTPSRIAQAVHESPAATTVIDRQMIDASGIRTIPELFRLVPGMLVVYNNYQLPQVKYHGLDTAGNGSARHLQVLIDGRSIYQSGFSRVLWTDIPLLIDDIERIEVVRSPSTVSHGANAFLGVINIITRNPADTTQLISLEAGSQDRKALSFRHSDQYQDLHYRLSANLSEHGGYDHNQAQKPDGQDLYLLNLRGEYLLTADNTIDIDLGYKNGNKEDGTYSAPIDGGWKNHYQKLHWQHQHSLQGSSQLTAYRQQRTVDQVWDSGSKDLNWDETRYHLELQHNQDISEQLRTVVGGSIRHDRVVAATYFGDQSSYQKNSHQLYGSAEWRLHHDLLLHGGVMWDHINVNNLQALSPRFALNYHLDPHHTLRASYSEAIRAPDLLEQFAYWSDPNLPSSFSATAIASARLHEFNAALTSQTLQPEEIEAHELGWFIRLPQWQLEGEAKLYQEKLSNLTALTLTDSQGNPIDGNSQYPFTHRNLDWATIRGIELETQWSPTPKSQLHIAAGHIFSYQSNNPDLSNSSPRNLASLLLTHRFNSAQRGAIGFYFSSAFCGYLDYATEPNGCSDSSNDTMPTSRRLDLSFQQKVAPDTTLSLLLNHHLGDHQSFQVTNENHGDTQYNLHLKMEW